MLKKFFALLLAFAFVFLAVPVLAVAAIPTLANYEMINGGTALDSSFSQDVLASSNGRMAQEAALEDALMGHLSSVPGAVFEANDLLRGQIPTIPTALGMMRMALILGTTDMQINHCNGSMLMDKESDEGIVLMATVDLSARGRHLFQDTVIAIGALNNGAYNSDFAPNTNLATVASTRDAQVVMITGENDQAAYINALRIENLPAQRPDTALIVYTLAQRIAASNSPANLVNLTVAYCLRV